MRQAAVGVQRALEQRTREVTLVQQRLAESQRLAAVGTFAATYGETTDRSQNERALYAVGTDVRLTSLGDLGRFGTHITEQLEDLEGVEKAGTAYRTAYNTGPLATFGARVEVLGLEPEKAPDLLWFRDDFADQDLQSLMLRLRGSPAGGSSPLPPW